MVAIDLGSNTIRIIEYDCTSKKVINEYEKIVKTADKLVKTHEIDEKSIERIISAIQEAKEKIEFKEVKAVATEALRQAKNSEEVLKKIEKETGVKFEIISSEQEAYFTAMGVFSCLKLKRIPFKNVFLTDIGGGSTELILLNRKKQVISESFSVGIVTMSQKYKSIEALEYGIRKETKIFKEFIKFAIQTYRPDIFVASSGTPTTIAALKIGLNYETYDGEKIDGVEVTLDDLDVWKEKLLKMEMKEREKMVGVGRGDLIVSGILIFKEIFRLGNFKKCIVCDKGLREGAAFDYCN